MSDERPADNPPAADAVSGGEETFREQLRAIAREWADSRPGKPARVDVDKHLLYELSDGRQGTAAPDRSPWVQAANVVFMDLGEFIAARFLSETEADPEAIASERQEVLDLTARVGLTDTAPDGVAHSSLAYLHEWTTQRHGEAFATRLFPFVLVSIVREASRRALERAARPRTGEQTPRTAKHVRMPVAGYNATTRTARMALDIISKHGLKLSAKQQSDLESWSPDALPLDARIVFFGLMGALTESGMMPDWPDGKPVSTALVPVPLPGGLAQLADYCGYVRTEQGRYGMKHDRSSLDLVKAGLAALSDQARHLFHYWEEFDRKEKARATRVFYMKDTIAKPMAEGTVRAQVGDTGITAFTSRHAQWVGLNPIAVIGAKSHYSDLPGDLMARYQRALKAWTTKHDKGDSRRTSADLEFLLWCYMHRARGAVRIGDAKLMDRIGLGKLVQQRKLQDAAQKLERCRGIAMEEGVLVSVDVPALGAPTYRFRDGDTAEPFDLEAEPNPTGILSGPDRAAG